MELENNVTVSSDSNNSRKKHKRNTDLYKRNVIKKSRLTGEAYINHKGNLVQKATLGEPCK